METKRQGTTVHLDPDLERALKHQSANTSQDLSVLVNFAIRDALDEDRSDLEIFLARREEKTINFGEMTDRLGVSGNFPE